MVATSRRKLAWHTLGLDGVDKAVDLMDHMDAMD